MSKNYEKTEFLPFDELNLNREIGIYEKYIKRIIDIICATLAITIFSWLYLIVALLVKINLGSPVIFKQARPGLHENVFWMYKFGSMSDKRDVNGELLPDEERMGRFGNLLRATSLDELPEAINILRGDMSVVGSRPLLAKTWHLWL